VENIENIEEIKVNDATSTRAKVRINNEEKDAIMDSGATLNLMPKKLQKKYGLKIIDKSNVVFVMADGKRLPAIGKVKTRVNIEGIEIPMEFEIVESRKDDLLIGTKTFLWLGAILDFGRKEMTIYWKNKEIVTKLYCTRRDWKEIVAEEEIEHDNEENEDEEYKEEYEQEDEYELYEKELENEGSEEEYEEFEEFEESPAYYLAELTN
jgi:hypothetical protein